MTSPRVSIIMRSKNSDWVIAQALTSLFSQTFQTFELLVVDSGSTDRTLEIVSNYAARVVGISATDYFPGRVLNEAIEQTDADIVVFQNSDTVLLTPDSLSELLKPFSNPAVQAAFGRQLPRPEAHTWVRRDYLAAFPPTAPAPEWMPLSLPLAAIRRSAWKQHPFQTDTWGSEDTEWGFWARRNGMEIRFVPDALVMHSHNYTLRQLYGRRFIEGEADAFIHSGTHSVTRLAARWLSSCLRDILPHLRAADLAGLASIPLRRWVYHWAYHKGHALGEQRRRDQDPNWKIGQTTVLDRYEP